MGSTALTFAALLLAFSTYASAAQHSTPMHDIQATFDVTALYKTLSQVEGAVFEGLQKNCGRTQIRVIKVNLTSVPWLGEAEGRYAVDFHLDFDAYSTCLRTDISCDMDARIGGLLQKDLKPIAECRAPKYPFAVFGFEAFQLPAFLEDGIEITTPECSENGPCIKWAKKNESGEFEVGPSVRRIYMPTRLFGSQGGGFERLTFNAHVGTQPLTASLPSTQALLDYIAPSPQHDFELNANLSLLESTRLESGELVDKGLLDQMMPMLVQGASGDSILGDLTYSFVLNEARYLVGESNGKSIRMIELNAYEPKIARAGSKKALRLFDRVRVRAAWDSASITELGQVKFHFSNADVQFLGWHGILRLRLGRSALAAVMNKFLSGVPVANLSEQIEIAIPACVVVDGKKHSDEAMELCRETGLLRHTAGVRGARAHLRQTGVTTSDLGDKISLFGDIEVTPIGVSP